MDGPNMELLEIDYSATVRGRTGDWICRGSDSRTHRRQLGRWRQLPVESRCFNDWRDVVLRHVDRDPHPGGIAWAWHGTRTGVGFVVGGAGIVVAEHCGNLQCDWIQENTHVRVLDGYHEHICGHGVRLVLRMSRIETTKSFAAS